MLPTRIESVSGKQVRLACLGDGPPLLLLHGYPDNLQIWCELAPQLAGQFHVIAFDWPGMGQSEAWPGGATPVHMADRLLVLVDAWKLAKVSLLGMDMGGQPALAFAARHPERIERLVVMNSLLFGDEPTSWEIRVLRRFGWNRLILRYGPRLVFRRAMRTFLPRGIRLPDDLRADLWNAFRRHAVRRFISKMCAGYQGTLPSLPALYRQIGCPTMALWGEADAHFPPVHALRLGQSVPGAQVSLIPGAHHWMAWYMADIVAERVTTFLQPDR
ncbi:MAG: alpha/beta hydrolase [Pirellulales bacterium]